MMKKTIGLCVAGSLAVSGCAGVGADYRPVIDPKMSRHNGTNYETDLSECKAFAMERDPQNQMLAGAILGAALGAALGAGVGSAYGRSGYGAAYGAGVGASSGADHGLVGGLEWQKQAIINCLWGRGYSVLG